VVWIDLIILAHTQKINIVVISQCTLFVYYCNKNNYDTMT